jgi:energy-coupling factor transporter ATP-binding protein EcfA2
MHVRVLLARYRTYRLCTACGGTRLRAEALDFRVAGRTVAEVNALPIADAERAFADERLAAGQAGAVADLILGEVRSRLRYLVEVGLGYLTLDRQSRTLSGGELERVDLTTAVGSSLVNTLFVLDEPSIGLHPRDTERLVRLLHRLRDQGNTVVVVEHDPAIIRAADHVIDLGPGPGERGGRLLFSGPVDRLPSVAASLTGAFLGGRRRIPVLVDPKVRHFARYRGVTVVTPNQVEAEQATGLRIRTATELLATGERLLKMLACQAALVTRGEHGMSLFERGRRPVHIPTAARQVYDVTGAGDTVIATLALALCGGATLPEAAQLANRTAGVVVGKVGTATATPEEVLASFEARG